MLAEEAHSVEISFKSRLKAWAEFAKLRLAVLVVFSAAVSYFMAVETFDLMRFSMLIIGGFLITGASNGFNQVIEKDLDALMQRTQNRPIPSGRMSAKEGTILSVVMAIIGVTLLWLLNPLTGILGTLALILYVVFYTPLKRISPIAVLVGAFPGAIPAMLGYIAESGKFGLVPGLLFLIQFIWQFPHFWAIAWKLDKDYKKAGFKMLPSAGGQNKTSALINLAYTVAIIPVGLAPYAFGVTGWISAVIVTIMGVWFTYKSYILYKKCDSEAATKLMFASFVYLPIVQLALLFDKI